MTTALHPQLVADCHLLGRFELCALLLHRNASVPWFILVPRTEDTDFLALTREFRAAVLEECARTADFLRGEMGFAKINFATLGNVVPQLHLHVIGRKPTDPCWPAPVWGNLAAQADYGQAELARIQTGLVRDHELQAERLA